MLNSYDFTMALALRRLFDRRRTRLSSREEAILDDQPAYGERSAERTSRGR
jgi:hypothetical protein